MRRQERQQPQLGRGERRRPRAVTGSTGFDAAAQLEGLARQQPELRPPLEDRLCLGKNGSRRLPVVQHDLDVSDREPQAECKRRRCGADQWSERLGAPDVPAEPFPFGVAHVCACGRRVCERSDCMLFELSLAYRRARCIGKHVGLPPLPLIGSSQGTKRQCERGNRTIL